MTTRELTVEDYPAVLELWRRSGLATLRPHGRDSAEAFARQLASGLQTVLGLEEDGALVGVVVVTHDGRKGWIGRLAVDPDARREGRGRRLIEAAEEDLRAKGIAVTAALVESDNEPSLRLFEKAGFTIARGVLYLAKRNSPSA